MTRAWVAMAAAWALAGAACGPGLRRVAGALEIRLSSIPAGADAVRLLVRGDEVEDYRVDLPSSGPNLIHTVPSVPAAPVELIVEASAGALVVARATRGVTVRAETTTAVDIDLSSAGIEVVSDPIPVRVTLTDADRSQERLDVSVPLSGPEYDAFLASARSRLGGDPGTFEVRSVRLELPSPNDTAEAFEDVWEDVITVRWAPGSGGAAIEVARGAPLDDVVSFEVPLRPGATALNDLVDDILSGVVRVELQGLSANSEGNELLATVEVTQVLAASF